MSFKPSKYQEQIFEHFKNSNSNAVIEAVAGSGKTTTLIEAMKLLNTNDVIFVAFNKHIADDIKKKAPKHIKVSTMHSFGLEQIKRVYKKAQIDPKKKQKLIKKLYKKIGLDLNQDTEYEENLSKLVDLFRQNLSTDLEECQLIALKHQITLDKDSKIIFDALFLINELNKNRDEIDFIDMIYIPAKEDIIIKEHELVLVDECQDLSTAQIALMQKMVKETGRFVAVGDRNQSIYGFGGADDESFEKLCSTDNTKILPLSISYRCSKAVVNCAKNLVPSIEYADNAPYGSVSHKGKLEDIDKGDFVLCRLNAPLVKLGLSLITEGKIATIKGMDIGSRVMKIMRGTKKIKPQHAIDTLWYKYHNMKNEVDTDDMNLLYFSDLIEAAEALSKGCSTIDDMETNISKLFSDAKTDGITLSTVHKSKGLEAKNVHIIYPEFMPLKIAKLEWEKQQEHNLHYVAITRAIENLSYIPKENMKK